MSGGFWTRLDESYDTSEFASGGATRKSAAKESIASPQVESEEVMFRGDQLVDKEEMKVKEGLYKGQWMGDMMHGKGRFNNMSGGFWTRLGESNDTSEFASGGATRKSAAKEPIASPQVESEEVMFRGDQLVEKEEMEVKEGLYKGQWMGDMMHGKGSLLAVDGSVYSGGFHAGEADGYGRFKAFFGVKYVGYWERNLRHGSGQAHFVDGSYYEGEWADDLMHGFGHLRWADGTSYQGEFARGCKHGRGVHRSADGAVKYDGEFEHDKMHGSGTFYHRAGKYVGQFAKGEKHGEGVMEWDNGAVYKGQYVGGKRHGRSVTVTPDGKRFEVQWIYGKEQQLS